ncbi:MAG TPA: ABC transporter permease [Phycisphaerae bacterium]|nr:ABC transporter permease [Phycisphaerae bacterium]HRY71170.1 ABC transporter permease [Phycisphaerae bacterium]HSA29888.1 ABC transporter permease [Phycisphaerae bacterium]
MNLSLRDVRHHFGRFILTTVGVSMLLMIVMGMGGIYRGLTTEAIQLVQTVGADIWVVQRGTRGPFAEISRVPENLVDRVAAVPGITQTRKFVYHTIQRQREGKPLRASVLGLDWPTDRGQWLSLVAGRLPAQNHFEMIADQSLGLPLGERMRLGKDTYAVVGLTNGMSDPSGNGFLFLTVADAQAIQFDQPGEAIRLERQARRARAGRNDVGKTQPTMLEHASGPSAQLAAIPSSQISAVMVRVSPGADQRAVMKTLGGWADVSVFTREDETRMLLMGVVERSRRQLGLFRVLLTTVSGIIMALILYTMTMDKLHDIALLKLIGAPNRVIIGLILQQAILLGALGYGMAYLLGQKVYPYFPRRVILTTDDLMMLAGVVLGISVLASLLGIWKALRVHPNTALMG